MVVILAGSFSISSSTGCRSSSGGENLTRVTNFQFSWDPFDSQKEQRKEKENC